jgi:nucleoside phosphorylase
MKKVLIIAALPRELHLLVKGWAHRTISTQNREVQIWESDHALAACAGIGGVSARIATDAAYKAASCETRLIISAGLAGALTPDLKVADIVQPATIADGVDGLSITTAHGTGTLLTSGALVGKSEKQALARSEALAVDMEAFAVADVARIHGVPCIAIKSISDTLDQSLPPLGRFISAEGRFQTGRFVLWTLLRPWCWLSVIQLGRNSEAALRTLTQALENTIRNQR